MHSQNHHKKIRSPGQRQAQSCLEGRWGGGRFWNVGATACPWVSSDSLRLVTGDVGMRTVFGFGTAVMALATCAGLGGRDLLGGHLKAQKGQSMSPGSRV